MLSKERSAFYLFLTIVVLLVWIPEYLPMVDIPQHAGQVFLLKQLFFDESKWQEQLQVNLMTPYLIGYGTWFLISLAVPVKIALKFLITLCFLSFIASFSLLRREFSAPRILEWILVPVFFGYAFEWGMITFLLALPIGVFFFLANIYWQRNGGFSRGLYVLIIGVFLFFSHGLVFVFFVLCASIFLFVKNKFNVRSTFTYVWPYALLAALTIFYILRPDPLSGQYSYGGSGAIWGELINRIYGFFYLHWGIAPAGYVTYLVSALVFAFPFILGMKPSQDLSRYVFVFCASIAFFVLPHYIANTFYVYERFSVLLIPAYILCFDDVKRTRFVGGSVNGVFLYGLWIALSAALMYKPLANLLLFNKEVLNFRALMQAVPEGKRALSWIHDRGSRVVNVPSVYLHFPVWYQVERDGWVDFSFSWFHPQVVRYRSDSLPEVRPGFEWRRDLPAHLDNCDRYELVFLHSFTTPPEDVLAGTSCSHVPYLQSGSWYVYSLPGVH